MTRSLLKENAGLLEQVQRLADPLLVVGSGLALFLLQFGRTALPQYYVWALAVAFLLCIVLFPAFRIYRAYRGSSLWEEVQVLFSAWAALVAGLVMVMFATKTSGNFSRQWMGLWMIAGFAVLVAFRMLLRLALRQMRRRGYNLRYMAIAGAGALGQEVARGVAASPWTGLKVTGFYDDAPEMQGRVIEGIPVKGNLDRLAEDADLCGIDQIWIALPLRAEERAKELFHQLRALTVQIRFVPDIYGFQLLNHSISEVAGFPVINLMDTPLGGMNGVVKAIEDKLLAALILLIMSPLMLVLAIGVKLSSPGPVLFKQKRGGLGGGDIWVWKFRSMKQHTEEDDRVTQAVPGDPRITRFGAFLRRSSLDELPQFFNVLRGEMAIVGPRPHATEHNEFYRKLIDSYIFRHHVKPGITGWAQVNGWRGETGEIEKMEMRVKHDLYYINNWSLWFDLRIIMMTVFMVITGKNAH